MKTFFLIVLLIMLASLPNGSVHAHDGEPHNDEGVWGAWNFAPTLLVVFLVTASLYGIGIRKLWKKSAPGAGVSQWQAASFFAGLLALAVALVSPLDALGSASLAWHMVQHLLVILVAAPFIILGDPMFAFLWAFPAKTLRTGGRWWNRRTSLRRGFGIFTYPLVVWGIHAAVLLLWHVPVLYQAALRMELIHDLEHASFLGAALLFWWLVLPRRGAAPRPGYGPAVLILFTTMFQGGMLGALLTFSKEVWYPFYRESTLLVSTTALEDQSLAGLLMWIPPSLVYLGAALSLLAKLLNPGEEYKGRQLEALNES